MYFCSLIDIKYNAEKDKKQKFEAKQRTLQRVEDAKAKEKEKEKDKGTNSLIGCIEQNVGNN